MAHTDLHVLLEAVRDGTLDVASAVARIERHEADLGTVRLDLARPLRTGEPEAIYAPGKPEGELFRIVEALLARHEPVIVTRVAPEVARALVERYPSLTHDADARLLAHPPRLREPRGAPVAVVGAGTSDRPVVREAAATLRWLGNDVREILDVGVAGLHRMLARLPELRECVALVVVAGMDGALPSVLAGLVRQPLVAVPTSVGYGASFEGLAALLAMLNACAPGVSVVNIDNGFGAAVVADRIARTAHG